MKKICITGGSGFIGTNAVESMISQGFDVINIDINPPKIHSHKTKWIYCDIRNLDQLRAVLLKFNPSHILHLAATTGMDVNDINFFNANTLGVKNLIQICNELPDLYRVVFTSSLLVCKNGYIPLSDDDYCPPNLYGKSKVVGEQYVRDFANNFSWVIVRPTSIWGPWFEHSYRSFFKVVSLGLYIHPGHKPIIKPLSYVGNTVHMMQKFLSTDLPGISGNTYYLADYPEASIQAWANIISQKFGLRSRPKVAPIIVLKVIAKCGDLLRLFGFKNPPLTSFRLGNMLTGEHYPIEKTEGVVGRLPYDLSEGVEKTISWMNNNLIQKD